MTGGEMEEMRDRLKMSRIAFASLIGYTGTDRNNETRVRKHEASDQVPLYIARYLWLIDVYVRRTGNLPPWPQWKGYEFDHSPDPGHERTADAG